MCCLLCCAVWYFHFSVYCSTVRNFWGRQGNPHAKYPKFLSKFWMLRSSRTTSTSTWWTGPLWTCSAWGWAPASTCGAPAPARYGAAYSCCFSANSVFLLIFPSACPGDPPVRSVRRRRFGDVCGLVREGKFLDFPILLHHKPPIILKRSPSVVRVTWWRWGLIRVTYRSGMHQQGRSCLYLKGTRLEWVSGEVSPPDWLSGLFNAASPPHSTSVMFSKNSFIRIPYQVRWHGTPTNCRLGVAIEWSCSVTSEPRPFNRSAVSRDTGRKSAASSGAQTTNCSPQVETTTRYVAGRFRLRVCSPPGQRPRVSPLCASPLVSFLLPGCSCLCGTTQVSSQCSSTQST